jgi:DNA (cytosine-5)-methyltransferase 1
MGTGGNNVPLVLSDDGGKIRKITPRECFRLQGFPEEFIIQEDRVNSGSLYVQAGNTISLPVAKKVANEVVRCLSQS